MSNIKFLNVLIFAVFFSFICYGASESDQSILHSLPGVNQKPNIERNGVFFFLFTEYWRDDKLTSLYTKKDLLKNIGYNITIITYNIQNLFKGDKLAEQRAEILDDKWDEIEEYIPSEYLDRLRQAIDNGFLGEAIYNNLPLVVQFLLDIDVSVYYNDVTTFLKDLEDHKNDQVFGLFTHGFHPSENDDPRTLPGFIVEYLKNSDDQTYRFKQLTDDIKASNLYKGAVPKPRKTDYIMGIGLEAQYINNAIGEFQPNGIAFLIACNSEKFSRSFLTAGIGIVFCFTESVVADNAIGSFNLMLDNLLPNSARRLFYSMHEARDKVIKINDLYTQNIIVSDNYTQKQSIVLRNVTHIDKMVISDPSQEYYNYEFNHDSKPRFYPYKGYIKNKKPDLETMKIMGWKGKKVPVETEMNIDISFSNNVIHDSVKVMISHKTFPGNEINIINIKNIKCSDKNNQTNCSATFKFDISAFEQYANIQITANDALTFIDSSGFKTPFFLLDKDGDGNFTGSDGKNDNNHWIIVDPITKAKSVSIEKLHLPFTEYGPPPKEFNPQPLRSDGMLEYPTDSTDQYWECFTKTDPIAQLQCRMDAVKKIIGDTTPEYYLNPRMIEDKALGDAKAQPVEIEGTDNDIDALKTANYPCYIAKVTTADEDNNQSDSVPIKSFAEDPVFRECVRLNLTTLPIVPAVKNDSNNIPGSSNPVIDVSGLYDIYLPKNDTESAFLVLPLSRLYQKYPALQDGWHTLTLETSNGKENEEKELYSSVSLKFFKDFSAPEDASSIGGSSIHRIKDSESGFNPEHYNSWYGGTGMIYDMAYNELNIKKPVSPEDENKDAEPKNPEEPDEDNTPNDEEPTENVVLPTQGCIQVHSQDCGTEQITSCHIKRTCNSTDFAICFNPVPYVTPVTKCSTWRVYKDPNVECLNNETYPEPGIGVSCTEGSDDDKKTAGADNQDSDSDDDGTGTGSDSDNSQGSDDNSKPKAQHSPQILRVTAEPDPAAINGVSLVCKWKDEDENIDFQRTRVFLVRQKDIRYFKELDLYTDIAGNNFSQDGFKIQNSPDVKEGQYIVKIMVEDRTGLSNQYVDFINIRLTPPNIKVTVDKERNVIEAVITDVGTPGNELTLTDFNNVYDLNQTDNTTLIFRTYIPTVEERPDFLNYKLTVTDLMNQSTTANLYADVYGPVDETEHDNDKKLLTSNQYDLEFESGVDTTRTLLFIDDDLYHGTYQISSDNMKSIMTFKTSSLSEGEHTAYCYLCDYNNNCGKTAPKTFSVTWPPEIYYLSYHQSKYGAAEFIEAKVWDLGKNLDPDGFELKIDGQVIPEAEYRYNADDKLFAYYPANPFPAGEHTATLIARDTTGLFDTETITFKFSGITNLILTDKLYRDIEGNGDGIINEGERIYLDLGVKNTGDALTQNTWGDLISRSRYIKGVAEKTARYSFIQPGSTAYNDKPFEFVVNEKVFEREDIDRVEAEFVLQLRESDPYSGGKSKTTEIPFTLAIERMDPAMALFEISVKKSATPTMEPALRLEGSWKTFGTDLRTLDIRITQDSLPAATAKNSLAAFQKDLTVIKNDAAKTFYADATLGVGDNRFVVTATADNGVVRTAEVSVRLTSQVGIALDEIAETASPNITVTGRAWTVNSKLESVEVYVNGGSMGSVPFDGDGKFSLPVTLNGGENIIRAVARDDQGKIASDEITVRMRGPLTIRWARANFTATATPYNACGSYEVEGDDITSIVTYINGAPNAHQVTIDRSRKTFCTTFDLQNGSNLLRAVGTTTGGFTANATANVGYCIGTGTLSVALNPLVSPTTEGMIRVTGSSTLVNCNEYWIDVIVIWGYGGEGPEERYFTATINPSNNTFYADVELFSPRGYCGATEFNYTIIAYVYQVDVPDTAEDMGEITRILSVSATELNIPWDLQCGGVADTVTGAFQFNTPGNHISNITLTIEDWTGATLSYNVTDYNESTGTWSLYLDLTAYHFSGSTYWTASIEDTLGCMVECKHLAFCAGGGKKIKLDGNNKMDNKRNKFRNSERNKRQPKRTVDGN